MEIVLVAWCIWACLVLLVCPAWNGGAKPLRLPGWLSSQGRLNYVVVSSEVLNQWLPSEPNLLFIDLCGGISGGGDEPFPGALSVSPEKLGDVLRWVPPSSLLVFCNDGPATRFALSVENTLLSAGIDQVYILERNGESHSHRPRTLMAGRPLARSYLGRN